MAQQGKTVPYAHGAAGHQGISTSVDGSLLIKPCTQAEIDFYESAKDHPSFQAHMPVYMGSLKAGDEALQRQAKSLLNQQGGEPTEAATSEGSKGHARSISGHMVSDPRIRRSATKEWTPSGGAKLSSNLSIVLSNATAGFQKPNVIDLKVGARLWDDDAPEAKRTKLDEVANASTSGSLGFRVAGMKVFVGEDHESVDREVNTHVEDGYKTFDKFYGRSNINDKNIRSAFDAFLYSLELKSKTSSADSDQKRAVTKALVVKRFLREMSSIEYSLINEESRMYSASVLMVYEGEPDALESVVKYSTTNYRLEAEAIEPDVTGDDGEEEEEEEEDDADEEVKQKITEVVLIDFAHAHWTPGQGPDENALKGIRSIKSILEQILSDAEHALKV